MAQYAILEGRVIDGRNNKQIGMAEVALTSIIDSTVYRQVTGVDGRFRFAGFRRGGAFIISISKRGYASYVKVIETDGSLQDLGNIVMIDTAHILKETLVKSKRRSVRISGDTIEYNATYYKTNPDMDAIYLLGKLPGIDLKDRTANGDTISKFAVNGIVIFNEQPERILSQLPAGVVEKIQVYNDTTDAGLSGMKHVRQLKVLNIKTTEGYFARFKGKIHAGYAVKDYFLAGGNSMKQYKDGQLSFDASTNRGGLKYGSYYEPTAQFRSEGLPWLTRLNLNFSKSITGKDALAITYNGHHNKFNLSRYERYQFGADSGGGSVNRFLDQDYEQLNNFLTLRWTRTYANGDKFITSSAIGSGNTQTDDDFRISSDITHAQSNSQARSIQEKAHTTLGFSSSFYSGNARRFKPVAGLRYSITDRNEAGINTGQTSGADTSYLINYRSTQAARNHNLGANLSGQWKSSSQNLVKAEFLTDNNLFHAAQEKRDYSPTTRSYSISDPYFYNDISYFQSNNSVQVKDLYNFSDGKTILELGGGMQYSSIGATHNFSKDYLNANFITALTIRFSQLKELKFSLDKQNEIPRYEQLNPAINTSTAFIYRTGNLDLKPANRYAANLAYKTQLFREGNFFSTNLSVLYITDHIVQNVLIPAGSDMEYKGMQIPQGNSLSYYDNVDDYRYLHYSINYDMPLDFAKTVWKLKASAEIFQSNSLFNYMPLKTKSSDYTVSSTFSSVISKEVDFSLHSSYAFDNSVQSGVSAIKRNVQVFLMNGLLVTQLSKRQSLRLECNINTISGLGISQPTSFYLADLSYQIKSGRDRKLMLTITLHDIFDSYRNYEYENRFDANFGSSYNTIYSSYSNNIRRYLLFLLTYNI